MLASVQAGRGPRRSPLAALPSQGVCPIAARLVQAIANVRTIGQMRSHTACYAGGARFAFEPGSESESVRTASRIRSSVSRYAQVQHLDGWPAPERPISSCGVYCAFPYSSRLSPPQGGVDSGNAEDYTQRVCRFGYCGDPQKGLAYADTLRSERLRPHHRAAHRVAPGPAPAFVGLRSEATLLVCTRAHCICEP
jgi:hypothetical protein